MKNVEPNFSTLRQHIKSESYLSIAGSDDAVVTRVKAYIDAGTCNAVSFNSEYSETECGDGATSYYKEVIYNNKRVVISNNVKFCI